MNHINIVRIVLIMTSLAMIVLGLNTGLGGIQTLGLRLTSDFVQIADPDAYAVQDNNVRFYGGFFASAGLVFLFCATNISKYGGTLKTILIMVALGGLARLSAYPFADGVIVSFLIEVVFAPLLYMWLHVATRKKRVD
ncbi:MAG: DUF4345 domain-containing protein [Chloroflexota bacterium]